MRRKDRNDLERRAHELGQDIAAELLRQLIEQVPPGATHVDLCAHVGDYDYDGGAMTERQIVHRIEDGMDRQQVACTTYQQRNFYVQLRDGFFSRNDTFNYALHHQVALWASKHPRADVLDVCCGRGLMLPLLRYHASDKPERPGIASYTGLDIKPGNATWQHKRVTDGKPLPDHRDAYYPFDTTFVEANVAQADEALAGRLYDFIIYTASIEHMHPDAGRSSLQALRKVALPGSTMVLTCPNTPEGQDGYDTRYRAHVYEWKLSELHKALATAGWHATDVWGLDMGVREADAAMREAGRGDEWVRLRQFVPQEWLIPALAPGLPADYASEVGLLCSPDVGQQSLVP